DSAANETLAREFVSSTVSSCLIHLTSALCAFAQSVNRTYSLPPTRIPSADRVVPCADLASAAMATATINNIRVGQLMPANSAYPPTQIQCNFFPSSKEYYALNTRMLLRPAAGGRSPSPRRQAQARNPFFGFRFQIRRLKLYCWKMPSVYIKTYGCQM